MRNYHRRLWRLTLSVQGIKFKHRTENSWRDYIGLPPVYQRPPTHNRRIW